jgi:hypothetical protein
LVQKKPDEWECQAAYFHQLIEPQPICAIQCNGTFEEADQPDYAMYAVELQVVTVVYGRSASAVPPISGYLSDPFEFVAAAQGDVRNDVQTFRATTLMNGTATWKIKAGLVQLEKSHDHFRLTNTASGTTHVQEFELPEGETFVTNLGEQPILIGYANYKVVLPTFLSWFQSSMPVDSQPWQMERFLLVRHGRVSGTR